LDSSWAAYRSLSLPPRIIGEALSLSSNGIDVKEFRNFVNSVDLEKRMFDGLLRRLLEFSDIPLEEKQLLLTGTDPEA
jgi:hypothetical protein